MPRDRRWFLDRQTLQLCRQTLSCRRNEYGSGSGAKAPHSYLGRGRLAEAKVDESCSPMGRHRCAEVQGRPRPESRSGGHKSHPRVRRKTPWLLKPVRYCYGRPHTQEESHIGSTSCEVACGCRRNLVDRRNVDGERKGLPVANRTGTPSILKIDARITCGYDFLLHLVVISSRLPRSES